MNDDYRLDRTWTRDTRGLTPDLFTRYPVPTAATHCLVAPAVAAAGRFTHTPRLIGPQFLPTGLPCLPLCVYRMPVAGTCRGLRLPSYTRYWFWLPPTTAWLVIGFCPDTPPALPRADYPRTAAPAYVYLPRRTCVLPCTTATPAVWFWFVVLVRGYGLLPLYPTRCFLPGSATTASCQLRTHPLR